MHQADVRSWNPGSCQQACQRACLALALACLPAWLASLSACRKWPTCRHPLSARASLSPRSCLPACAVLRLRASVTGCKHLAGASGLETTLAGKPSRTCSWEAMCLTSCITLRMDKLPGRLLCDAASNDLLIYATFAAVRLPVLDCPSCPTGLAQRHKCVPGGNHWRSLNVRLASRRGQVLSP